MMVTTSILKNSGANPNDNGQALVSVMDFAAGENYRQTLSEPELVFVLEGQVTMKRVDGIQNLEGGCFLLSVPGNFLYLTADRQSTVLVCRLGSEHLLYDILSLPNLESFRTDQTGSSFYLTIDDNLKIFMEGFVPLLRKGFSSQSYHEAKTAELLYLLRESYSKSDLAILFYPLIGPDISFKNFVFNTVHKAGSVNELAELANMSVTGFRTKFTKIMGVPPSAMLSRIRADLIRHDLLYTDLPLKEISEKYGFNSIYVFTRFCSRQLGTPPGNLRKMHRSTDG